MTEPITWATLQSGIRAMEEVEARRYRCGQCGEWTPFPLWLAWDGPMVCNKCWERVWHERIDIAIKTGDRRTEP